MQTKSYLHIPTLRISMRLSWREAIVINLISKFAFKPKQMRFIVKSYWQYAFTHDVIQRLIIMANFCRIHTVYHTYDTQ